MNSAGERVLAPITLAKVRFQASYKITVSFTMGIKRSPVAQRFSRHPFVCAVCHSKPRVLWMEIRRSRMSAFLTSYAHAFCTVTWRDLVLHVRKNRKRRSLVYRELYPFQKFAIPLENLQFHWSMYPYERGSVSTVVCHLFVVRVPERSAVCSQAVSGETSANFERPSRSNCSSDSRQQAIVV